MVVPVVHNQAQQAHDFTLTFPDGTVLGFIAGSLDREGNFTPSVETIHESQIDRTALKTTTGQSKYSDFEWPYMSLVQDDWSGGRGAKNFEDNTVRYADGGGVRTERSGRVTLGGRGVYTYGFKNLNQNLPGAVWVYEPLIDDYRYLGWKFTAGAGYTTATVQAWLRKVGTPGTLTMQLRSDNAGEPGVVLKTATLLASAVDDVLAFVHSFAVSQALTNGVVYWVVFSGAATDTTANCWEIGRKGGTDGASSVDGTTWTTNDFSPLVRVLDDEPNFRTFKFEYKRALYMVKANRGSLHNAILYINGDRGAADDNTADKSKLNDATKAWVTDEFKDAIVLLIEGPGSEESQPWRKITGNDATSLSVSPDWITVHTTETQYVILKSDKWTSIQDLGGDVTDVAVADSFVYFARGEGVSKPVYRFEAYNDGGTWTNRFAAETFSATYLYAIRHPDEGMVLYGGCNLKKDGTNDYFVRRVWKGNVPKAWASLYRSRGSILDTGTPWDGRSIGNVIENGDGASTIIQVAAAFGSGVIAVKNLDAPVDLRGGSYIGFYIISTVNVAADKLQLLLSDQLDLGADTLPRYAYHFDGTTATELPKTRDGDASTKEDVTLDGNKFLYLMGAMRFDKIEFDFGTTINSVAGRTMTLQYFNGSAWTTISSVSDTTIVGGTTWAQDGNMTFTAPSDWQTCTFDSQTGYWIRMKPNDALTPSINVNEIQIARTTKTTLNLPALTANTIYFVNLSITPRAAPDPDMSVVQSLGLNLVDNLGEQNIYITGDIQLLSKHLDYAVMPNDAKITGMTAYAGNQYDPYNNPWVFTENRVYEIQTQNGDALVELPIGEIKELASENTGLARTVNDVYLYFSLGPEKVQRYFGRNLDDVGPDLDEGLPANRRGNPSALLSYPGRVFLAIDAGDTGYSSVLAHKGSGWHEVWRAERPGARIRSLYHQSIPGSVIGRLWIGVGNDVVWVPYTLSQDLPPDDVNLYFPYTAEGYLESPWIYGNMVDVIKQWRSLKCFLDVADSYLHLELDYKTEDDVTWTTVAGSYDTVPSKELIFSSLTPPNLSARRLKYRLRFYGDGSETPILTAVLIEAYGIAPVKYRWVIPCLLTEMEDRRVNLDENEERILGVYTSVETAIDKLRDAVNNGYALLLNSRLSPYDDKVVMLSSAVGRPVTITHHDQPPTEEHLFQIVMDLL